MKRGRGVELLKQLEEELRKNFWQENKALHRRFAPDLNYDSFRSLCGRARNNVGEPEVEDSVDPRYDPDFKPDATQEQTRQALQWISNDLYRSRMQTTMQLRDRCLEAGYGKEDWKRKMWNSIVGNARKNTGRKVNLLEISYINRKSSEGSTMKKPLIDIHAPPPDPMGGDTIAVRRLAMEVIQDAIVMAGKKESKTMGSREESSIRARSFDVRYAKAWLQTPSATAIWCGVLNLDPDMVADYSRRIHGVPKFSREEIESHKRRVAEYDKSVAKEIEVYGSHHR